VQYKIFVLFFASHYADREARAHQLVALERPGTFGCIDIDPAYWDRLLILCGNSGLQGHFVAKRQDVVLRETDTTKGKNKQYPAEQGFP
jgi:hypothetical protein